MEGKIIKSSATLLSFAIACSALAACAETVRPGTSVEVPDLNNGYTYTKQNNDGLMQFYSSDEDMDAFLNEYMRRHLRYDDESIGDLKIGDGSTVWKEWEAMSVMWMNTAGIGYSPKTSIASWFSTIYQDAFGYIWVDSGTTTNDWGQSWQFPNMGHSYFGSDTGSERYLFLNTSYLNGNNNIGNAGNGSNELSSIWKGVSDAGIVGTMEKAATGYYDYIAITGNDMTSITYTYETPDNHYEPSAGDELGPGIDYGYILYEGKETPVKKIMATPFCSPFLELDFSITDFDSLGSTQQVEDVIVSWKGGSGVKNSDWDDAHTVRYSEFSTNYKESFSASTHIVFPMYAHPNWGVSEELEDAITDMKIEIVFKNGINAEVRLEEVTLAFDGRQVNNNSIFVAAAAYYYQYAQDDEWLAKNIDKIRAAMQFLITYCQSEDEETSELLTTENFVGHDGSSNYDYYGPDANGNPGWYTNYKAVGHGIGDGYWDCPSNPCVNLYCNIYYYKALAGMEYLERMVKASGIEESGAEISVRPADMSQPVKYTQTAESLREKINAFIPQFRRYFWNEETGRFLLGYLDENDAGVKAGELDTKVDYGFTTYNQEAIELGLASEEQAASIMSWINGERTVDGDTADNSSKAKQIYQYSFAPRWSTKENVYQFWYRFSGAKTGTYGWNKQVQNGGTAAHCAYYDLLAEDGVNGSQAAFGKLINIMNWYNTVKEAGGTGANFYRAYYTKLNVKLQGGSTGAGVLGLDYEFIEAALLYSSVPAVFFGLSSTEYNTLNIAPDLPSDLNFWKMENLSFANLYYDLSIGDNWVQINSVQGDTSGKKVCVTLDAPEGEFTVRQHNVTLTEGQDYVVSGGKVVITAPFRNGRIQIVNK